jgi:predicted DNA binding CopG/RHH family protein
MSQNLRFFQNKYKLIRFKYDLIQKNVKTAMKPTKTQITLRLDESTIKQVDQLATDLGINRNTLIIMLINKFIKSKENANKILGE